MKKLFTTSAILLSLAFSGVASAELIQTENYWTDTTTGLEIIKTVGNRYSTIENNVTSGYYDTYFGTGGGWRLGTTEDARAIINGMFGPSGVATMGSSVDNDPLKPLLDALGRPQYSSYWRGMQTYLSFITKNEVNPENGTHFNSLMWYIAGTSVRAPGQNVRYSEEVFGDIHANSGTDYYAPLVVRGSLSSFEGSGSLGADVNAPFTLGALMLSMLGFSALRKKKR